MGKDDGLRLFRMVEIGIEKKMGTERRTRAKGKAGRKEGREERTTLVKRPRKQTRDVDRSVCLVSR